MGLRRTRGFGYLRGWREAEVDEALAALLAAGTVERRRRGFVPARLSAPRRWRSTRHAEREHLRDR
jgi:hypothetical protein